MKEHNISVGLNKNKCLKEPKLILIKLFLLNLEFLN